MSSTIDIVKEKYYLDNASTRPLSEIILDRYVKYSKDFPFNLSASYNKFSLEELKSDILATFNLSLIEYSLIVTASASEALSQAIVGTYLSKFSISNKVVTTRTEHKAVLKSVEYLETIGAEIIYTDLDEYGRVDLSSLRELLKSEQVLMFCVNHVNNESGTINPVEEIGKICSEYDVLSIIDTTQSIGKTPINYSLVDMFCVSSHKLGGINGVGLLIKRGQTTPSIIHGNQQGGQRGGSIFAPSLLILRDLLKSGLIVKDIRVKTDFLFNQLDEKVDSWEVLIPEEVRVPYIIPIVTNYSKIEVTQKLDNWIFSFGSSCNSSLEEKSHVYSLFTDNEVFRLSL